MLQHIMFTILYSTVDSTYMHGLGTASWLACKRSVHLTAVSL